MGASKRAHEAASSTTTHTQQPRGNGYYRSMDWDEYDDEYGWYAWGPDQDEVLAKATAALKGVKPESNTPSSSYVNQG